MNVLRCCLLYLCVMHAALAATTGADAQIAIVYNRVREDIGFNRLIGEGVRRFEEQNQAKVRVISHPRGDQFQAAELETALTKAVAEGINSVLVLGANYPVVIEHLSKRFPKLRIVVIDSDARTPGNVQTVRFRAHEAAFLAGIVAARTSRAGTLGFVGGLDYPGIRSFGCAFAQGAHAARPEIKVLGRMIGDQFTAFADPRGGARKARELLKDGADVIFAAAGGSGLGVLEEVARARAFGIGVDENQNGLHPGRVLTSVLKRMDVSVYTSLVSLQRQAWKPGPQSFGLTEGAVGLAMDEYNHALIDRDTRAELEAAEFAIRSGEIEVIDAEVDETRCAALIHYPPAVAH